jgi:DNA-directed RNA polymerase II subunit RPB2
MTRMNWMAMIAHLRCVNTPINRDSKDPKPRQLHSSHWGIVCPCKTPEGASTGLIKNLATLAHLRVGHDPRFIESRLNLHARELGIYTLDIFLGDNETGLALADSLDTSPNTIMITWTSVLVNGRVYGYVSERRIPALLDFLRKLRRAGTFPFDVSIVHRQRTQEIAISCDSGCVLRPVLYLERFYECFDDLVQTTDTSQLWPTLLYEGVIEYVF